ncbi:hypothetical protein Musp01_19770 [Muricauda sp. NBRC 101325]|nr:hypothetical protein Musp01_19770 [Muricauda sp. NBRC 101325]
MLLGISLKTKVRGGIDSLVEKLLKNDSPSFRKDRKECEKSDLFGCWVIRYTLMIFHFSLSTVNCLLFTFQTLVLFLFDGLYSDNLKVQKIQLSNFRTKPSYLTKIYYACIIYFVIFGNTKLDL